MPFVGSATDETVVLQKENRKALSEAIDEAVVAHESDFAEMREKIRLAHQFYELDAPKKNFPWKDASNVNFPVVTTAVDAFKSKIKQTLRNEGKDQWHAEPTRRASEVAEDESLDVLGSIQGDEGERGATWADVARAVARFCNVLSDDDVAGLNWDTVSDDWIDTLAKEGTAPIKIMVTDIPVIERVVNPDTQLTEVQLRWEPTVVNIPLAITECVWPSGVASLNEMWLFGHRMELSTPQLKLLGERLKYTNLKEVLPQTEEMTDPIQDERDRMEGITRGTRRVHRVYVLSVEWTVNGKSDSLIVTWHRGSKQILRIVRSPFWLLNMKGYEIALFERRGRRFLGRGMPQNLMPINRAINTALNQTFDQQSAANAFGLKVKAGSSAADQLEAEGVRPGTTVYFDDDPNEIEELRISDTTTFNTIELVKLLQIFAERVSRVSDAAVGQLQSAKRTPASSGMTILQEGATLMDEVIGRFRITAGRVQVQNLHLWNLIRPSIFEEVLGEQDGGLVQRAITQPRFPLSTYLRVTLKATSSTRSKDMEHARILNNVQILLGYYTQLTQLVPVFANPQVPPQAKDMFVKILEPMQVLMERLISSAKLDDPDALVPDLAEEFKTLSDTIATATAPAPAEGGEGGPSTDPQVAAAEAAV